MNAALIPATARPYPHPVTTRRAWVVGYAVESTELGAGDLGGGWARDAAQQAERLGPPRAVEPSRALRLPPRPEAPPAYDPHGWHQAGMPLPTSAFLAMRDATRHCR